MEVDVSGTSVNCPWPSCKDYANRHNCFGRPKSHLVEEGERHVAYPDALDSDENAAEWDDLRVRPAPGEAP